MQPELPVDDVYDQKTPEPEDAAEFSLAKPGSVRMASPEPVKAPSPEPVKAASPEPVKEVGQETAKAASPEPTKATSPEPVKVASPEPVKEIIMETTSNMIKELPRITQKPTEDISGTKGSSQAGKSEKRSRPRIKRSPLRERHPKVQSSPVSAAVDKSDAAKTPTKPQPVTYPSAQSEHLTKVLLCPGIVGLLLL